MKKYDVVRGLGWTLLAAMLLYLLTLVYPIYDSVFDSGGNGLLLYLYVNSVSFGGWLLPLFACLPFASSYVLDMKNGFQRTAVLKYGSRSYIKSKILVASLSGGLALSGGLILFWLLLAATGQSMTPDETLLEYVFLWDILKLDGSGLLLYIGLLYLSFLSGAFWTLAALAFSTFCMDAFLTVCFPVFCQRFILQLLSILHLPDWLNLGQLGKGTSPYSYSLYLPIATVVFGGLSLLAIQLFKNGFERRLPNA